MANWKKKYKELEAKLLNEKVDRISKLNIAAIKKLETAFDKIKDIQGRTLSELGEHDERIARFEHSLLDYPHADNAQMTHEVFDEGALVVFGEYLFSKEREQRLYNGTQENDPRTFEERLKTVSHADIENWKEIYRNRA